jgi:L-glyceraldehyde 3-phosphate reductase
VRDPRMTSAIIGVSSVSQLEENIAALANGEFSKADLDEIDRALKPGTATAARRS